MRQGFRARLLVILLGRPPSSRSPGWCARDRSARPGRPPRSATRPCRRKPSRSSRSATRSPRSGARSRIATGSGRGCAPTAGRISTTSEHRRIPGAPSFDPDHEGHGGWTARGLGEGVRTHPAEGNIELARWPQAGRRAPADGHQRLLPPRVPAPQGLLHPEEEAAEYAQAFARRARRSRGVIETVRKHNPDVALVLARIPPIGWVPDASSSTSTRKASPRWRASLRRRARRSSWSICTRGSWLRRKRPTRTRSTASIRTSTARRRSARAFSVRSRRRAAAAGGAGPRAADQSPGGGRDDDPTAPSDAGFGSAIRGASFLVEARSSSRAAIGFFLCPDGTFARLAAPVGRADRPRGVPPDTEHRWTRTRT